MTQSNATEVIKPLKWPGFAACVMACAQVIRDIPGYRQSLDWQILSLMYQFETVTYNTLYTTFNKDDNSNYRYYSALDRLTAKGFAQLSYGPKGWRQWAITPAGRDMIAQLDAAAQKYLHKKAGT